MSKLDVMKVIFKVGGHKLLLLTRKMFLLSANRLPSLKLFYCELAWRRLCKWMVQVTSVLLIWLLNVQAIKVVSKENWKIGCNECKIPVNFKCFKNQNKEILLMEISISNNIESQLWRPLKSLPWYLPDCASVGGMEGCWEQNLEITKSLNNWFS